MPKNQKAYSLIEILVVMMIVCVLGTVLFAVSRTTMQKVKSAKCLSNIKQTSSALLAFGAESGNNIVSFSGGVGVANIWGYQLVTGGYIPKSSATILRCPVASDAKMTDNGFDGTLWYWYTYGLNMTTNVGAFSFTPTPNGTMRLFHINMGKLSGKMQSSILLADSFETPMGEGRYRQSFRICPKYGETGVQLRHNERGNVSFMDGHVESLTRDEFKKLSVEYIYDFVEK